MQILAYRFIILSQMKSNRNPKSKKSVKLASYEIKTPLPFKITSTFIRASLRYERDGHWNQKQKIKYSIFITYFRHLFQEPKHKKTIRLYEMMSDMIVTRNPNQCRSHHQKMQKYRNTIPQIVASVAEKYEPRVFKEMEERYMVLIKGLLENQQKYIRTPAPPQPIRYIYTNFVSNANQVVLQKQVTQKPEIMKENMGIEEVDRKKAGLKNTADSYNNERISDQEDSNMDQTPVMEVVEGANSESKQEKEPQFFNNEIQVPIFMPKPQKRMPFIEERSRMLALQTKSYYEQQLKLLRAKREWHLQTIQQLTMRLANEHGLMKDCEATIKLYQRTLRSTEFSN